MPAVPAGFGDDCCGAELAPGTGACGTPEPGLGEAGLSCAQINVADSRDRANSAIGEQCISERHLLKTSWMQPAATQMAGKGRESSWARQRYSSARLSPT